MYKKLSLLFFLLFSLSAFCQSTDLARLEYTYFPQKNSDNSFRRMRAQVAFPIALKKEGSYLIPGLEYRNVQFKYEDPEVFDTRDLDRFQSFTASLGYTFKMNDLWRFGAEGGVKLASNFAQSDILQDDLIYTGAVYFIKIKEDERYYEPWRLILGLQYSTTTGFPFPLPIVNYYKRWDEKWSYMLGIPKSNLKYYFNGRQEVQLFLTLDGFFSNIQNNFDTTPGNNTNDPIAESMSMTILLSGLGYEFSFTDHLKFYVYGGHTLINDIRFRDADRNNIYTINETNTFYARSGLKFTIL
ncbi:DUF6268 family outer membrane beta-barrel protein [Christiangramia sediminis]|uniref:DUF6268 family outer membrane beta-barrel protein n=1 Tax=Christiangramia sediminis TaxID=2881336 RepID=A0A9X1RY22_9FLAO|nr:DUF6268 family outer membrane beta-barrel protein [Christiangramia sediminis]MCB7481369.1 DUF6268 family outer membrane beta-barrel protein [Christiangramia sediminis]